MNKLLAIATAGIAVALAGCAAPQTQAPTAKSGEGKEVETVTGSRIPSKSSSGSVQGVSGDAWRRDTTPVIGNAPRGG